MATELFETQCMHAKSQSKTIARLIYILSFNTYCTLYIAKQHFVSGCLNPHHIPKTEVRGQWCWQYPYLNYILFIILSQCKL